VLESLVHQMKLLSQCLMPECHPDVWNIGFSDVIASGTMLKVVRAKPIGLNIMFKSTLIHTVPCDFTSITITQVPHLCCNTIFLHQWFLCIVELKGVVCRETDIQTSGKEIGEGVAVVVQKQRVIAQW
jgi:hypothetical protein